MNKPGEKATKHLRNIISKKIIEAKNKNLRENGTEKDKEDEIRINFQSISELAAYKEMFDREKQQFRCEITNLREKLAKSEAAGEEFKGKIKNQQAKIGEIRKELEVQVLETLKELKFKQYFENQSKELQKLLDGKEKETVEVNLALKSSKERAKILEGTINEQKLTNELLSQNNDHISQRLLKLQSDYDSQTNTLEGVTEKCARLASQAKAYEENASKMLSEVGKFAKRKEAWEKKLTAFEGQRKQWNVETEHLTAVVGELRLESDRLKKALEAEKRTNEELKRERELARKAAEKVTAGAEEQSAMLKVEMRLKEDVRRELDDRKRELKGLNETALGLERDKDRLKGKNAELLRKLEDCKNRLEEKEQELLTAKRALNEAQTSHQYQMALLDNVRSDKDALCQSLSRATDEISDLKETVKLLQNRMEDYKCRAEMKEMQAAKEKSIVQKLEQEKYRLNGEILSYSDKLNRSMEENFNLRDIINRDEETIARLEREMRQKDKNCEKAISEQELRNAHFLQKCEEICRLNAELKLRERRCETVEGECKRLEDELRAAGAELKKLKMEKAIMSKSLGEMVRIRSEAFNLEKKLAKEKSERRALEEELRNPVNVHRWRKLEATNPEMYELIEKIRLLQRRLLSQTELAAEREDKLRELENLYGNLRDTAPVADNDAFAGGKPSVRELSARAHFLRKDCRDKEAKIKELTAEARMYAAQAADCKAQMIKKNEETDVLKAEFYEQKNVIRKLRKKLDDRSSPSHIEEKLNGKFAVGGGFKIVNHKL